MKKLLFIIILSIVTIAAYGQREKNLPMRASSTPSDTVRVLQGGSSIMTRETLQSDIYDSLSVHTDTLQALRADIDAGGSADLSDSITAHRLELNDLHDSIDVHRVDIDANLDSIAIHRTELDNLSDSITDHRTDIDANAATGVTNAGNISSNSVFIGVNTADIASLEDSITKHTDTLQVHQGQIAALQAGGGGDVTKVGTPADGQIGVWTGDGTIEGTTALIFDDGGGDAAWQMTSGPTGISGVRLTNGTNNATFQYDGDNDRTTISPHGELRLQNDGTNGITLGQNTIADTHLTVVNDNGVARTYIARFGKNNSTPRFSVADDGRIWMETLGSDDTEDHLVAIDDATGLLTKRAINLQFTGALTDGTPTDAQIDAATGTTPAAVGAGWRASILDTDGSALVYLIISDGSNWQYFTGTIAL